RGVAMRPIRLRRWIVPGTVLSLALAAVGFLAVGELGDGATPPSASGAAVAAVAPSRRSATGDEGWEAPVREAPRERRPTARPPVQQRPRRAAQSSRAPQRPLPTRPGESPRVLEAGPLMPALAREATLRRRLELLDEWLLRPPEERAVRMLDGLLSSHLPGSFYEAESLRLAIVDRVADYSSAAAREVLVARLDPERPRPERMLAIEKLAARKDTLSADLERIAARDHDSVVQQKARWALSRQR